ncbi:hypothetical protein B566_EDAN007759, partial [Ephemera danica]
SKRHNVSRPSISCRRSESTPRSESVDIGGIIYVFAPEVGLVTFDVAETYCSDLGLTLPGFETEVEWTAVMDYLIVTSGKQGWYWTSGLHDEATNRWLWSSTGTEFSATDPRWEPGQPGTGPWSNQRVTFFTGTQTLYPSDVTYQNNVMCETPL